MDYYTISMSEIDQYYEKQYQKDLSRYFVLVPMGGYRYAESVRQLIYPKVNDKIENRNLFAAFVCCSVMAQNVLNQKGGQDLLTDFLIVSRMPRFLPYDRFLAVPSDFMDRAGLPSPDVFVQLMMDAAECIYKELEHTLKGGRWRSNGPSGLVVSGAEERLLSLPDSRKAEILASYQMDAYMFMKSYKVIRSERKYPPFNTRTGSILRGDKYGLDGVVIFHRRGFYGLNAATKRYVSNLQMLKDLGDIKVYRHTYYPLKTVIVYTYSDSHNSEQALNAFKRVMNVASEYLVKRLGMNGLELTADVKADCGEGQAMMNLVKESLGSYEPIPFSEICFIDPHGAFGK